MKREYSKWHSVRLGREMELLAYGTAGTPVVVFPTSMGHFYEFEDWGMVTELAWAIEGERLQLFCVHSVDKESWHNRHAHPAHRVLRHMAYESYVQAEVLPFIAERTGAGRVVVTGASFGGYHATNFALKYPEVVRRVVSMSGAYDIRCFLDGYFDENCYFNSPFDYLSNLTDEAYLGEFRHGIEWVLAAGEHDICLGANRHMSDLFHAKQIPHTLDIWGQGAVHDWPLWRQMVRKYFN